MIMNVGIYGKNLLKPDVGNSLMGLEQKQELLVLLGLFKIVLSICTPEKMVNRGQHRMNNASNQLELNSAEVDDSICHLNTGSFSGSCHW